MNRKKSFLNIVCTNEAYESDCNENYDVKIDYPDMTSQRDVDRPPISMTVLPIITLTRCDLSIDNLPTTELFNTADESQDKNLSNNTIQNPEEVVHHKHVKDKDNLPVNMNLDNMSLSNFKLVHRKHSDDGRKDALSIKRTPSDTSIILMKDAQSDLSVQTGINFRKTSTFIITPKASKISHNIDDEISIQLIDKPSVPELFIEFDNLRFHSSSKRFFWVEKSRWLKFEEDYNSDSKRFNCPHLSPISIGGISDFRNVFSNGQLVLDCHQDNLTNVLNHILDLIKNAGAFSENEINEIRDALILKHVHAGEIMKMPSEPNLNYGFTNENQSNFTNTKQDRNLFGRFNSQLRNSSNVKLDKKLQPGTEALSVQVAALDSLQHTVSLFVRLDSPINAEGLNEVSCPLRFIFIVFGPKAKKARLLEIGRVFSVMMSNIEFREAAYAANTKKDFIDASKVFVTHSVLVPLNKVMTHDSLAGMLPHMKGYLNYFESQENQKLFDNMKLEIANKNQEITIDNMDNDLRRRISINSNILNKKKLSLGDSEGNKTPGVHTITSDSEPISCTGQTVFKPFCPPFRHFFSDWKGLGSRYISDYRDAFTRTHVPIVFIGMVFIYFVVLSPALTFGALLNEINPKMTVTMMLLASGFFELFYTVFGGQPFEVVGITGPVFSVEKVLSSLALSFVVELGAMRFWIGVYVAVLGVIFTAFNCVIIIKHFRRSVEEIYNFLVAAIYILSALFSMFKALPHQMTPLAPNGTNIDIIVKERFQFGAGGATLFLAFLMANFCLILVQIKKGSFFRRQIRNLLGSLNVPLGIILIIAMDKIFFKSYSLPKLNAPSSNSVDFLLWFNVPTISSLMSVSPQAHGLCFAIAVSLFAILTCESSTNSILATKSERKLVKPSLYSINYFYILVLFPLISGTLGWPFVSGAPVRSHSHCMAMSTWSVNLPGVPAKVTGAVEQRISGIFVGTLVLLSVFMGSILRLIPMAAMYGMFLYMGIMGAMDLIFIRRLINILQRRKYWDAHDFLKDYPTWNIMMLVLIQIFFVSILIVLNCISEFTTISWTPLLFPVTILLFGFVRGYILPRWPRLNSHLSKMDKKHQIRFYADQHKMEQVILTVEQKGVMKVVRSNLTDDSPDGSSDWEFEKQQWQNKSNVFPESR